MTILLRIIAVIIGIATFYTVWWALWFWSSGNLVPLAAAGPLGIITLIGLAAKNAILIVEFARLRGAEGKSAVDSALEAARLRLRPILMTSFAFILGVLPLTVATGAGAASRRALGTAVFGGMIAATLLAVFIVPVLYVVIQRFAETRLGLPQAAPSPSLGGVES